MYLPKGKKKKKTKIKKPNNKVVQTFHFWKQSTLLKKHSTLLKHEDDGW